MLAIGIGTAAIAFVLVGLYYASASFADTIIRPAFEAFGHVGEGLYSAMKAAIMYAARSLESTLEWAVSPITTMLNTTTARMDLYTQNNNRAHHFISGWINNAPKIIAQAIGIAKLSDTLWTIWHTVDDIKKAAQAIESLPHYSEADIKAFAWTLIGQQVSELLGDIAAAKTDAQNYAKAQADAATAVAMAAQQSVNKLAITVTDLTNGLAQSIAQLGKTTATTITTDMAQAVQNAQTYTQNREAVIDALVTTTFTQAEQDASKLVDALGVSVSMAISQLNDLVSSTVIQLDQQIAQAKTEAQTYTDQAIAGVMADIGVLSGTLANTGAKAEATATTLTDYLEECGTPVCDNLKPLIPSIQDIESTIEEAALFALVAEAIAHPKEAAQVIRDMVTPIANQARDIVEAFIPKKP